MIVLGFDPSDRATAFAVLDMRSAFDKPRFLAKGDSEATEAAIAALIQAHAAEVVGVEDPSGFIFNMARTKALMETKGVASRLVVWAGLRVPTIAMPAAKIRNGLIGRPKKGAHGDAAVKRWIALFVEGWPKQSDSHTRDSAMVAIYAGRTTLCERRDARGRRPA